jgi:hypothetical protein
MVFGKDVDITVNWTRFDFKGDLELSPTKIRLNENVVDFLDQCNINNRKPFEMVITLPLIKKGVNTDIFGLFWYIPFENDSEQRPTVPILPVQDEASSFDKDCIIRCYWQNRLVLDSIVRNLPFFGEVERRHRAEGISPKWRERMIGLLFLDWQFDDISNNKLRFLESLEILMGKTQGVLYSPIIPCEPFIKLVT